MGWRLSAINGIVSSDLTLDQIIEKLSMTQRPLTMTFIKGSSKHDLEDIREQIQKTEQSVLQKEPGSPERVRMERHANEMKKKQEQALLRLHEDEKKQEVAAISSVQKSNRMDCFTLTGDSTSQQSQHQAQELQWDSTVGGEARLCCTLPFSTTDTNKYQEPVPSTSSMDFNPRRRITDFPTPR